MTVRYIYNSRGKMTGKTKTSRLTPLAALERAAECLKTLAHAIVCGWCKCCFAGGTP